ncbi:hypothetical protein B296_00015314 [Ensete ventricosum]|uniref:Beta-glucosidase n=1 Tax=Ensete ventricosum TaxID=4639 RepID=A0A426ZLK5_ENSVE|nr:hypothetical protein B296_00015314 [Ensete ventricosum]
MLCTLRCTKCCLAGVPNCHVLTEYVPYYVFWRVSIERHLASVLRTSPPYPSPYPFSKALDPRVSQSEDGFYHRTALARLVSLVPTFGIGPAARTDHCRVRPPLLLLHLTPLPMARRRSEIDGYDGIPDEVSRSDFPKDFVFGVATSAYQVISVKSP